jgi:hypothetical protein
VGEFKCVQAEQVPGALCDVRDYYFLINFN